MSQDKVFEVTLVTACGCRKTLVMDRRPTCYVVVPIAVKRNDPDNPVRVSSRRFLHHTTGVSPDGAVEQLEYREVE